MSPIEQRIAIAEACGWTNVQEPIMFSALMDTPAAHAPRTSGPSFSTIPNYLNDLNAMHEVENAMGDEHYCKYCTTLNEITCPLQCENTMVCGYSISAPADKRAEAFLRTLGKWVES